MKTYFQNGTSADIECFPDYVEKFCVQKMSEPSVEKYIYTRDSIKYDLDSELAILYDKLRDLLFENVDEYYSELDKLPIFVQEAGFDSDCKLDSKSFLELVEEYQAETSNFYKHLYLVDIQFLVATVQNLLDGMDYSLINYFVQICNIDVNDYATDQKDTVVMLHSQEARYLSSLLESYFTKAYSILDILTKIVYEFENKHDSFDSFKKTKSAKILWGDRKRLSIKDEPQTIFVRSNTVKIIEALRNEVVHNGSLEQNPKVFVTLENNEIVERFMLLPDFIDGNLATVKNRKHFFSECNRANDLLPQIHLDYLKEILSTIKYLNANH